MMVNKEKNFVSAVVYVHNTADRIEKFIKAVINVLEDNFEHSEIICVNDGSVDDSLLKIKNVSQNVNTTSISVVNMSGFHGLEIAMNAGMDLAIGDFVFEFDNTFIDYDESVIMDIYRRSLQGYDIVSASPDRKERLTSRLFYNTFRCFANTPINMHTESFRILSRRAINRIDSMNKTVPYRKAIYSSTGLKTDTIVYKTLFEKKYTTRDKTENKYRKGLAVDSLLLFTELGYRLSIAMTLFMMFISVFVLVYSVIIYATAHPVAGWTTTILFLSVAFFGLFGILTVIIKYLQLLVNLVFKRKQYSFESIEKLTK